MSQLGVLAERQDKKNPDLNYYIWKTLDERHYYTKIKHEKKWQILKLCYDEILAVHFINSQVVEAFGTRSNVFFNLI